MVNGPIVPAGTIQVSTFSSSIVRRTSLWKNALIPESSKVTEKSRAVASTAMRKRLRRHCRSRKPTSHTAWECTAARRMPARSQASRGDSGHALRMSGRVALTVGLALIAAFLDALSNVLEISEAEQVSVEVHAAELDHEPRPPTALARRARLRRGRVSPRWPRPSAWARWRSCNRSCAPRSSCRCGSERSWSAASSGATIGSRRWSCARARDVPLRGSTERRS